MTLFQILNRFSFLILPLLLFALIAGLLAWRRAGRRWWAGWAGLLLVFLAVALATGQSNTPAYDTPANIRQALANSDQPTLIEFFSNY